MSHRQDSTYYSLCYIGYRALDGTRNNPKGIEHWFTISPVFYLLKFLSYHYEQRKAGDVLFNDALNAFYSQLYGVGHMVKDHLDSKK